MGLAVQGVASVSCSNVRYALDALAKVDDRTAATTLEP